jgi:hypothetical protein
MIGLYNRLLNMSNTKIVPEDQMNSFTKELIAILGNNYTYSQATSDRVGDSYKSDYYPYYLIQLNVNRYKIEGKYMYLLRNAYVIESNKGAITQYTYIWWVDELVE